jgi:hypothetical protein
MRNLFFVILLVASPMIQAAQITFDFVFEDTNNGARAEGFVVFDDAFLLNPTNENMRGFDEGYYNLPDAAVVDLQFTITGSQSSNGDYFLSDFGGLVFQTNGGTLNLQSSLIGQPTDENDWGTAYDGSAGDFNLFSGPARSTGGSNYQGQKGGQLPNGCNWFTLCTNFENMVLQAMIPRPQGSPLPVPALDWLGLMALLGLFFSASLVYRQRLSH